MRSLWLWSSGDARKWLGQSRMLIVGMLVAGCGSGKLDCLDTELCPYVETFKQEAHSRGVGFSGVTIEFTDNQMSSQGVCKDGLFESKVYINRRVWNHLPEPLWALALTSS